MPSDVRESPIYPLLIREFGRVRDHVELYDLAVDLWVFLAAVAVIAVHVLLAVLDRLTEEPSGPASSAAFSSS